MPAWVEMATQDYLKRLQEFVQFNLVEIPLQKRSKDSNLNKLLDKEAKLILSAIPHQAYVVALEIAGQEFMSEQLAKKIELLKNQSYALCILIGGPEGLHPEVLVKAQEKWSLSRLTLPHPLVRIVLLETLYRSFAILNNHPYHK